MEIIVLLIVFAMLFAVGVPIAFSIGIATTCAFFFAVDSLPAVTTVAQRIAGGLNSFALLAIPLFILSGQIMAKGGIARRLIDFSKAFVGMMPGGLAFVNVISCMLFGSISGSAVAATSAIGGFMVPEMKKEGYNNDFSAALTATASTTGLLIPPSNILIIYAVASGGVSIAALFVAGYLPGILMGLSLMIVAAGYAKKHNIPRGASIGIKEFAKRGFAAVPSLLLIVIVIGGILRGVFTATEAGGIAVVYSLILAVGIYREVKLPELTQILIKSAETTAIVMFLIGTSIAMSWLLAFENVPAQMAALLLAISDNPIVLLLLINLLLLAIGIFMDLTPAVLIFTPILLPVVTELGLTPLHFGIILIMNLTIGLCTPPVGSILFVSCSVANSSISKVVRPMIPMYLALIAALMLVTFVPEISEFLPRYFGLIK